MLYIAFKVDRSRSTLRIYYTNISDIDNTVNNTDVYFGKSYEYTIL